MILYLIWERISDIDPLSYWISASDFLYDTGFTTDIRISTGIHQSYQLVIAIDISLQLKLLIGK